jgi:hypothetical protein
VKISNYSTSGFWQYADVPKNCRRQYNNLHRVLGEALNSVLETLPVCFKDTVQETLIFDPSHRAKFFQSIKAEICLLDDLIRITGSGVVEGGCGGMASPK